MSIRPRFLVTSVTLLPLVLLTGCLSNLLNLVPSSSTSSTVPDYTGNYALIATPINGVQPTPVTALYGAIANTGSSFTGTFRLVTTNSCVSPTQDITFTGNRDALGQVGLTSTNLPSNVMTISLLAEPDTGSAGVGTYTITGAGACAMPIANYASDLFYPITGTYTGAIATPTGATVTATATVTQGTANSDGQFPETGTLTVASPTCTNTFSFNGIITGPKLSASLTPAGSATAVALAGTVTASATQMVISPGIAIVGACNPGVFGGALIKQ